MDITHKFKQIVAKLRKSCYVLGTEFMEPDFKINLRTLNIAMFISIYLGCSLFTICTGDPDTVLQCLVFLGTGAQGCIKFPMPIRKREQALALLHRMESMYYDGRQLGQSSSEYKLLDKCAFVCAKVFSLYVLIFAFGFLVAFSYPVAMYFVFDQKVLMITMVIPGVDPFGKHGFIIHGVCHTMMALILCVGSPAGDTFFMLSVAHTYVYVEFLRFRVGRFNDWLLATQDEEHDVDWHESATRLLDEILREHQNLLEFMDALDEMYFLPIAVHIGMASFSLGIGLFMTVTTSWYVAFMLVLVALFQLFVYSFLGTIVEVKNESLLTYVYEILWYLLPLKEQRKMILLLIKCQQPKEYMIAGMAPLNLDTLVKILKTIYSFFMMLVNSL